MNKQQLSQKIWESANKMRSKIEANEYKDYILGFVFYKFLSEKEEIFLKKIGWKEKDLVDVKEEDADLKRTLQEANGYFIAYDDLFSTWIDIGREFNIQNVTDAISAFNRNLDPNHKKVFEGIFNTLETGISKLGDGPDARTSAARDLIYLIDEIPMDGKQDYDVLGFIYEYLISNFAANAGKKAGEFYTPHEVSLLMAEIVAHHLKKKSEIRIYDPTSGSGSLLINIGKSVSRYAGSKDSVQYYAQELKENTFNLTRMNLVMRGILPSNIVTRNADTLEEDWPLEKDELTGILKALYVDAVVSNPPYSQAWNRKNKDSDERFKFGLAPAGKADYAFLLHDLYHLKPDGIMAIVMPHGVLFRGNDEEEIRKNLIEHNKIDAIIGLPPNIFFGTSIPTIIMVLKQNRKNDDVLIIDASKGSIKAGKKNALRARDIRKIADVIQQRQSVDKFSRVVSRQEIRNNGYNLNITRYVDSSDAPESWDLWAMMFSGIPEKELLQLQKYWDVFPSLKDSLYEPINENYKHLKVDDLTESVFRNQDVLDCIEEYKKARESFSKSLSTRLLTKQKPGNIIKTETALSKDLFTCLLPLHLVDPYDAYQLFTEHWADIAIDLEIIQTEGFAATKKVDPHMVTKKPKGKPPKEVQEGWEGHILPFDLVQKSFLLQKVRTLNSDMRTLSDYSSRYEDLLNELPEDEKEKPFVNEEKDAFVQKEIAPAIKSGFLDAPIIAILKKVQELNKKEKALKKKISQETEELNEQTKLIVEKLDDKQVLDILHLKWIEPLTDELRRLPQEAIVQLITSLQGIEKKYRVPFTSTEKQIIDTEKNLSKLADELTGDKFDMESIANFKELLRGKRHD